MSDLQRTLANFKHKGSHTQFKFNLPKSLKQKWLHESLFPFSMSNSFIKKECQVKCLTYVINVIVNIGKKSTFWITTSNVSTVQYSFIVQYPFYIC